MARMRRKEKLLFLGLFLCLFGFLSSFFFLQNWYRLGEQVLLGFLFLGTLLFLYFFLHTLQEKKSAKVIIENALLSFQAAYSGEVEGKCQEKNRIFISSFGLLLPDEIIQFNQKEIWLRHVIIKEGTMAFVYGRENQLKKTKVLCPLMCQEALAEMAQQLHFDTGAKITFL